MYMQVHVGRISNFVGPQSLGSDKEARGRVTATEKATENEKLSPLAVSNWTPSSEALTREHVPIKRQGWGGVGRGGGSF